jgi:hypothetical protein
MKDEISKNMNFSAILDKDGVVEMGRKSAGLEGLLNFGKGIIVACFHAKGTLPDRNDSLKMCTKG